MRILLLMLMAGSTVSDLVRQVAESGRVVSCADTPSDRVNPRLMIAPGAPPVLGFRTFDAMERGRLSEVGLMMDDAGH